MHRGNALSEACTKLCTTVVFSPLCEIIDSIRIRWMPMFHYSAKTFIVLAVAAAKKISRGARLIYRGALTRSQSDHLWLLSSTSRIESLHSPEKHADPQTLTCANAKSAQPHGCLEFQQGPTASVVLLRRLTDRQLERISSNHSPLSLQ